MLEVDRLQDDWFIGAISLDQAELVLSKLILTYREYGLEINGSKTSVERTSSISDQQRISEIGAFLSHNESVPRGRRLSEFLSLGIRMQVQYPHQPVVNYVLSVIENRKIARRDSGVVESFLLRAMVLSPVSITSIVRVLINLHHDTKAISVARVVKRLNQELIRHFKNGNTLEIIWILYAIRGLSGRIYVSDINEYILQPNSSAIALVLLDMSEKGLVVGQLPRDQWSQYITLQKANTSGLWLLAYEGIRHGWLSDPHNLAQCAVFAPMLLRNIEFYDPKRNVATSRSAASRRIQARIREKRATFSMMQHLRGFAMDDY